MLYRKLGRTGLDVSCVSFGALPLAGLNQDEADQVLNAALDAIGGIGRFIHAGERVVIKPNVGWDRNPAQGANTHPDLVSEMVRLCLGAGAAVVWQIVRWGGADAGQLSAVSVAIGAALPGFAVGRYRYFYHLAHFREETFQFDLRCIVTQIADKNFAVNVGAVKAAISKKTKIIFLANPNSPTGTIIPQPDILKILLM